MMGATELSIRNAQMYINKGSNGNVISEIIGRAFDMTLIHSLLVSA